LETSCVAFALSNASTLNQRWKVPSPPGSAMSSTIAPGFSRKLPNPIAAQKTGRAFC